MIAHMRKSDYEIQTVQDHLESVSALAKEFGKKAGFQSMTELSGFLHDMGKNTKAFSTYIENAVKETGEPLERFDHSTAGAKYLYETYYIDLKQDPTKMFSNFMIEIVGMVILSHHSGLQNFIQTDGTQSDYFRRVCREDLPYYEEVCTEFFQIPGNKEKVGRLYQESVIEMQAFFERLKRLLRKYPKKSKEEKTSHYVYLSLALKYVFSCLIDADRTDSRRFDEGDTSRLNESHHQFFEDSYQHLTSHLQELARSTDAVKPINKLRAKMSEQCDRLAESPSAIYQLSIPTGGGKTLASLRYALKHAKLQGKDRIIYVVPYTTILEQNADAVRKVIKNNEMVLEHHSNVIDETESENEQDYYQRPKEKKIQLARDNYDHPIIFTTMVQFLDAFYAKGTRKARRLHNLANAVIIFDEVQSVPVKHIPLFNSAVNFIHHFGNSSILLCTATQPTLAKTEYPLLMGENKEMIDDLPGVVKAFERVSIVSEVTNEGWSAEGISDFIFTELEDKESILIILNTKKAVLNLYEQLKDVSGYSVYHLSTSMCPQHRKDMLSEIRSKLDIPGERVICVSTQLIEAGVDISFECVIRSLAGLDSIAQAAGRCNRNGEREKGVVYVIHAKDEALSRLPEIALGQKVTEEDVLSRSNLANDLLSPVAIQTYFEFFLKKANSEIQMNNSKLNLPLIELIDTGQKYFNAIPVEHPKACMRTMFKTLESHFEVIEAPTTGILVPYEQGKDLIASLNEDIADYDELNRLMKEAQLFSVNVYSHTLHKLVEEDLIYPLYTEGLYALQDSGYHEEYGLSLEGEGQQSMPIY